MTIDQIKNPPLRRVTIAVLFAAFLVVLLICAIHDIVRAIVLGAVDTIRSAYFAVVEVWRDSRDTW
ncbi:hypothetical protein ACJMQP_03990 [Rhodopseudomonas palustris]